MGSEQHKNNTKANQNMTNKPFRQQINEILDLPEDNLKNVRYDAENECLVFEQTVTLPLVTDCTYTEQIDK